MTNGGTRIINRKMTTRPCAVCGKPFQSGHPNHIRCGSEACRKAARRAWDHEASERIRIRDGLPPLGEAQCPHCGVTFRQRRSNQVTCGSKQCKTIARNTHIQTEWKIWRKARPEEMTKCIVCGADYLQEHPRIITCANPECKRTVKNRRTLASKHAAKWKMSKTNRECLRCRKPFRSENGAWLCNACRRHNAEICRGSGLGAFL